MLQEIGYSEGDGLTSDIVERLKSKKKSEKNQSDGDRWKEIYRLLFPHEIVPNPCTMTLPFDYYVPLPMSLADL